MLGYLSPASPAGLKPSLRELVEMPFEIHKLKIMASYYSLLNILVTVGSLDQSF